MRSILCLTRLVKDRVLSSLQKYRLDLQFVGLGHVLLCHLQLTLLSGRVCYLRCPLVSYNLCDLPIRCCADDYSSIVGRRGWTGLLGVADSLRNRVELESLCISLLLVFRVCLCSFHSKLLTVFLLSWWQAGILVIRSRDLFLFLGYNCRCILLREVAELVGIDYLPLRDHFLLGGRYYLDVTE